MNYRKNTYFSRIRRPFVATYFNILSGVLGRFYQKFDTYLSNFFEDSVNVLLMQFSQESFDKWFFFLFLVLRKFRKKFRLTSVLALFTKLFVYLSFYKAIGPSQLHSFQFRRFYQKFDVRYVSARSFLYKRVSEKSFCPINRVFYTKSVQAFLVQCIDNNY